MKVFAIIVAAALAVGVVVAAIAVAVMLQPRTPKAEPAAKRVIELDAKEDVQTLDAETEKGASGDFVVEVRKATLGRVKLRGGGFSGANHLIVELQIANTAQTKRLVCETWGEENQSAEIHTLLVDEFKNEYKRANLGLFSGADGASRFQEIYPESHEKDVLVFEKPIKRAETLSLLLPGKSSGIKRTVVFRIPRKMIRGLDE